jgi:lipoprotein-anchoring transpeptidase ErfK/SrfK
MPDIHTYGPANKNVDEKTEQDASKTRARRWSASGSATRFRCPENRYHRAFIPSKNQRIRVRPTARGISATELSNVNRRPATPSTNGAARVCSAQLNVRVASNSTRYGGFAMLSRFLAGAICAAGLLVTTCANADPGYYPMSNFMAMFSAVPRQVVSFPNKYEPGTIIISTRERRLYLVLGKGQALKYGIGVGRDGFTWAGTSTVTDKREWPDWTPPAEMIRRRPDLPRHMRGGPANPLGARALYLGDTMYRIHGSNEPHTIGTAATSGCIRLTNEDVIDLYNRVKIGATVIVQR